MAEDLGEQVQRVGGTWRERGQVEPGEEAEHEVPDVVLRGRQEASAVAGRLLEQHARCVAGDVGGGEDAAGRGHVASDRLCDGSAVEAGAPLAGDPSQRVRERGRVQPLARSRRVAAAEEVRGSPRLRADVGEALEDDQREMPVDGESRLCQLDRRFDDLCERQSSGPGVGGTQSGHCPGHARREGAVIARPVDHIRPLEWARRPGRLEPEEIGRCSGRRTRAVVDRQESLLARQPCGQVAVAAETRVVRLDHERGERARHGGIHGVATLREDAQRRRDLLRMSGGDGAASPLSHRLRPSLA